MSAPTLRGRLGTDGDDRGRAPLGFESGPDYYIFSRSAIVNFWSLICDVAAQ